MKLSDVDLNKVSPMMKHYISVKMEYPDVIIFYRLGDFYEVFFEDAVTTSRELELTLTGRNAGLDEKVPMCGVPYHAVSIYIEKMIEKGYKIGICEQLEDPKNAKGIVSRGITQIISKGTVISSESLKENDFNYIGFVMDTKYSYIISYADITTGVIYVTNCLYNQTSLVNEVINLGLKEVIVNSNFDKNIINILKNQFDISITINDLIEPLDEYSYVFSDIKDENQVTSVKYLITYILNIKMTDLSHLQKAIVKVPNKYLHMDIHTKRNLELTETLRLKQRQYSLIWLLDKTKTAMGSRLLKTYIENPLVDIDEINKRYDIVDKLISKFILREDLKNLLNEVYDLERLSGRIAFLNANARDLLQLKRSLKVLPEINEILKSIGYTKIDTLDSLYDLLENSIYENPPIGIKEGYLIKDGFNSELDSLKDIRSNGKDFIARFELEERQRTGIKTLKVGYNKVFGYYIEVSKGMTNLVKESYGYSRKQTLSNCERYISPVLKEKESLILNAEEKIINLEYELFINVRDKIKEYIKPIQEIAKVISEIDVLQSFATVSEENNYIRPVLTKDNVVYLKDNRHAVVEKVLNSEYVSNDIIFNEDKNILLITGPNMAGKSTYMRQLAITVIMAQIGCFTPCTEAKLKIFDAIYTRIGASDDLVSGESTFMVEMKEANNAISNATSNSLLLFDELGRGTATFDGMALAQAIIEYIHDNIKCKMMFSTHYHELTDLENTLKHLKNVHVSALEENGNITFLHKIKDGSVDKSYGLHVASLAKLPDKLIKRASDILSVYESREKKRDIKIQESFPLDLLESKEESKIEKKIKELDVLNMTPIEALNALYELKKID